jgi:hypothetical protein
MHRQKGVDAPPTYQQCTKLFPGVSHVSFVIENTLDAPELRKYDRCLDYLARFNT